MYSGFDKLIIGGAWRPGKSQKVLQDRNPYTGARSGPARRIQ